MDQDIRQEKDAFLTLFLASQKKIFAYILLFIHNRSDAEDILQETTSILWNRFDKFDRGQNFAAWGIGIARNVIRKHWSRMSKDSKIFSDRAYENIIELVSEVIDQADDRAIAIEQCVAKLDQVDKNIIKMRYQDGMKIKAIAQNINRSTNGIYQTMSRIHLILQKCIIRTISSWDKSI
ncbi:MAG: sigma-70 family RNA polymerase sigma factor [Phycisphaerae bacterium]|nr:sigma-70 family RNA polymerase sigma factor [Phycisphaerae bacterium]